MKKRSYVAPDGARWGVEVRAPSSSNVMLVFHHPDARTSRRNRYAWYAWSGDEARDVTARLKPKQVLERLTDDQIATLFRRSMPVSTDVPSAVPSHAGGPGDLP
jgi:hypothetical protein